MTRPLRRPVGPPLPSSAVVLPGHRPAPHSEAYRAGVAQYLCTCGHETVPAPPTTAAALWRHHLEVNMVRSPMLSGIQGQFAGKSIAELIWDEMDTVYARLMSGETEKGDKGMARGLATALAILTNPYARNVDDVREQAHRRWEAAQPDEEEDAS